MIYHKKHLGTMEKNLHPRLHPKPAETKPCGVRLQVNFDDHVVLGSTVLDTKVINAIPKYRYLIFQDTFHLCDKSSVLLIMDS